MTPSSRFWQAWVTAATSALSPGHRALMWRATTAPTAAHCSSISRASSSWIAWTYGSLPWGFQPIRWVEPIKTTLGHIKSLLVSTSDMLLCCLRLPWWWCCDVEAQGDACAWPWPTWRLALAGSGSAAPRALTSCVTSRTWSRNTPAGPRFPPALTFLCWYVAISMQSQLRRCTGVSSRHLWVWTRPIRNSARTVWRSRSTRHGRFVLQGSAAPLWTTSGTVRTHWEWTQFWTCPLRSRLGRTGFHLLAIPLTISLWFVTSASRRRNEKEVTKPAHRKGRRCEESWLASLHKQACSETPRASETMKKMRTGEKWEAIVTWLMMIKLHLNTATM